MENRAGKTALVPGKGYKAFEPNKLPPIPALELKEEVLTMIGEANRLLGKLDGLSLNIPDMNLFIGSYVRKEALMSSQIEGTQTSLVDVLDPSNEETSNMDILDVIKYTKALNYAIERLKTFPLCNSLLKNTHKVLLTETRGHEKNPGEFRTSQNWIGAAGCTLNNARYVPPTPEYMIEAMSDLEKYFNNDDNIDPIVKAALVHYQFETIHPFLDGNGRMGRMLIVLNLMNSKVLTYPILYISYHLKKNRVEYYDRLEEVRLKGNYEQWVKFFLQAVIETCKDSIQTIEELSILREKNNKLIKDEKKSILRVYSYLEKNPIIDIQKTAKDLGISYNTVATAVKRLCELKILKQETTALRNKVFHYENYVNILKRDTDNLN